MIRFVPATTLSAFLVAVLSSLPGANSEVGCWRRDLWPCGDAEETFCRSDLNWPDLTGAQKFVGCCHSGYSEGCYWIGHGLTCENGPNSGPIDCGPSYEEQWEALTGLTDTFVEVAGYTAGVAVNILEGAVGVVGDIVDYVFKEGDFDNVTIVVDSAVDVTDEAGETEEITVEETEEVAIIGEDADENVTASAGAIDDLVNDMVGVAMDVTDAAVDFTEDMVGAATDWMKEEEGDNVTVSVEEVDVTVETEDEDEAAATETNGGEDEDAAATETNGGEDEDAATETNGGEDEDAAVTETGTITSTIDSAAATTILFSSDLLAASALLAVMLF